MVESAFLEDLKRKSGCGTWRELSAEQDRARSMAGLNEGFPNFKNSMILWKTKNALENTVLRIAKYSDKLQKQLEKGYSLA